MSLSQDEADTLLKALKDAVRTSPLIWEEGKRNDEKLIAVEHNELEFVLSMSRNPFEIRLHLRTQKDNVGLCRIDAAPYHSNPDGTELRNQPHIHIYKEGFQDKWAEPIDWYDIENPYKTLLRFLSEIQARFPSGIQTSLM